MATLPMLEEKRIRQNIDLYPTLDAAIVGLEKMYGDIRTVDHATVSAIWSKANVQSAKDRFETWNKANASAIQSTLDAIRVAINAATTLAGTDARLVISGNEVEYVPYRAERTVGSSVEGGKERAARSLALKHDMTTGFYEVAPGYTRLDYSKLPILYVKDTGKLNAKGSPAHHVWLNDDRCTTARDAVDLVLENPAYYLPGAKLYGGEVASTTFWSPCEDQDRPIPTGTKVRLSHKKASKQGR